MVCKKEVINWFRDLSACRRIEFLCALMDCCGPLELRFLGTYIEDLGRRDYDRLREMELNANDVNYLSKLINISDIRILDKVLTSLALMYSTCKDGARVLFKTLKEHTDTILNRGCPREPSSETHEKVVLLAVMALNHPAFTFSEKQALRSQLSALLQAVESIAVAPSELENDEVNGIQDITNPQKETQSQLLSKIPATLPVSAEQNQSDAIDDVPVQAVTSCNDDMTGLENKKNFTHQDQENLVFICNIEGKGLKKRPSDKRYEYIFMVHWSDKTVTNVSKTHGQLLDFQCKLNKLFPEEAGEQHQDRVIPYLPGKRIFSTAHKGELAEKMLPEIAEYAKQLSALPQHILQCELTYTFFQSSEVSETTTPDSGKVGSQANPTAHEQDVKSSPSPTMPTQVYQQLTQHIEQQQIYPLQTDVEQQQQQQLQLHYQQQMVTNPLQQQYHGQMLRQQQQMHQPPSSYIQASLPQQMVPQQVTSQQPLSQNQQSMHQQQPPSIPQQQGELSMHQGQQQPVHQQGMPTIQNQSHPVPTSQNQQLPPHPVHQHYQEFYTQQDIMATAKQSQGIHQQYGKYSKQQQQQQQQQAVRQLQHLQQPQLTDNMPSRHTQSDLTPPTSQPATHHNLTALVSQMHISQHHQVNLSTPNIPPTAVSNSSSSSLGVCKQCTAVTSSVVATTASSSSVYYQTVTSIVSIQSPSSDPYTTASSNTGSSQQVKTSSSKEQPKHSNNTTAYTQNSPPPMPKHTPSTPTYTASLMTPSPSHSPIPLTQSATLSNRSWETPPSSNMAPPTTTMTPPNSIMAPSNTNMAPPSSNMASPNINMVLPNSNMVPPNSNLAPPNSNMALPNSNMAPPNSNMAPPNSNMAPPNSNMAPPNSNMAPPNSNMALPNSNMALPNSNMSPPISNAAPPICHQFTRDNVDPLIREWLKKQRLHKYTKFFEGRSVEQVSDKEVDSWDIVQGAKGRIKSQLKQLRQKGLSGLNGMTQLTHTHPLPLYYPGSFYPSFNTTMALQPNMHPAVGGEGTGSEGSSSPSSPRESSDENERESEGSEGSVLSSPDSRSILGANRESGIQQQQQCQDFNGTQGTHTAQQVNTQFGQPHSNPLPTPHGNQLLGNPQPNPQTMQGSPLPVNMNYIYSAACPSSNLEQLPTGPVDLRRLIHVDVNQRQPDSRLTPVPMMEITNSAVKGGNGSHGGNSSHIGGSGGIGNSGSGMNIARQQVPRVAHLGDPTMMGMPPPNVPPPLPSNNQMDIGANIPPQVVSIKQQQQHPPPQQQQPQQQSIPGIQYSVECADSNMFKMPSIVVPDVVPTSTISPGPSIPSSLPLTPRNDGQPSSVSGTNSPRLLPSPVNPNFPGTRTGFAPQNIPTTFAMRLGGEQYQAPTSVTYVTSMAQSPSINLSNTNVYENNPMVYNNNQTSYPAANPGCTSCGCSGQCGTSGAHHGPVHHFPLQSAYPSSQVAYQNIPNFFPSNLPGMPPPNNMIPGSPRFPGPMLPFQNIPNEMPYGGNGQFGLMPHGQVYLSGLSYGHRGNHGSHGGQVVKKLHCYNCGGVGHRHAECREPSMESITQNSHYRLNFKPVPESNSSSDS